MMIPNDFYYNRILNEEINLYYKEIIELEESAQICVFLYFLFEIEKKEKSENLYYIDCLPKDETYFPVFFSDENKDLLKGSIIIDYINKNIQKFKKEFQILKNKFSKLNTVEFKDYLKVRLTLGARIFDTDKINYVNSAVPIADLFNFHPEKVNCYWKVDENNNFYVKAIRDIEEEEEVILNKLVFIF